MSEQTNALPYPLFPRHAFPRPAAATSPAATTFEAGAQLRALKCPPALVSLPFIPALVRYDLRPAGPPCENLHHTTAPAAGLRTGSFGGVARCVPPLLCALRLLAAVGAWWGPTRLAAFI